MSLEPENSPQQNPPLVLADANFTDRFFTGAIETVFFQKLGQPAGEVTSYISRLALRSIQPKTFGWPDQLQEAYPRLCRLPLLNVQDLYTIQTFASEQEYSTAREIYTIAGEVALVSLGITDQTSQNCDINSNPLALLGKRSFRLASRRLTDNDSNLKLFHIIVENFRECIFGLRAALLDMRI